MSAYKAVADSVAGTQTRHVQERLERRQQRRQRHHGSILGNNGSGDDEETVEGNAGHSRGSNVLRTVVWSSRQGTAERRGDQRE